MGAGALIEDYLADLAQAIGPLGRTRRRRIVSEARDHLIDAAAREGDVVAIERFGSAADVGAAHVAAVAGRAPRRSVIAFGAAGLAYGVIQFVASPPVSGLFPPGPWPNDVPPASLAWKVDVAGGLIAIAFLLGCVAIAEMWRLRRRPIAFQAHTARIAVAGAAVFAASWPFETMFLFQRSHEVAGSPGDLVVGVLIAGLLACHVAALTITVHHLHVLRHVEQHHHESSPYSTNG